MASRLFHLHEEANLERVNELLNQPKANILLSLKEGSSRNLFESMFADTPVIALKNNVVIKQSYINKQTDKLINERHACSDVLSRKKILKKAIVLTRELGKYNILFLIALYSHYD